MSFQCDEQAVPMFHFTGSTMWRKEKTLRKYTVLLWMGTSPESHFQSTPGHISARFNRYFILESAEVIIQWLLDVVETFATGPTSQNAGIVIVEARHQPPIQPLYNESYHWMPHFDSGTTYIVPISVIQRALNLPPSWPLPYSTQWYMRKTIDFNSFEVHYMLIIWFDAWSHSSSDILNSDVFTLGI